MAQTSKKLYETFAREISDLPASEYPRQTKVSMACLCARIFGRDNERFDMSKFYEACGLNDDIHKLAQEKAARWLSDE